MICGTAGIIRSVLRPSQNARDERLSLHFSRFGQTTIAGKGKPTYTYAAMFSSRLFALLLMATSIAGAQDSLADRAAKARQNSAGDKGRIVNGDYQNDVLGFSILRLEGWDVLSRGQMNINEAFGRKLLGQKAGVSGGGRVYGLRSAAGETVTVAIEPLSPGQTIEDVFRTLRSDLKERFPKTRFANESHVLSAPGHPFHALRAEHDLTETIHAVYSFQGTVVGNLMIEVTVAAPTQEKVTAVLRLLKKNFLWR